MVLCERESILRSQTFRNEVIKNSVRVG